VLGSWDVGLVETAYLIITTANVGGCAAVPFQLTQLFQEEYNEWASAGTSFRLRTDGVMDNDTFNGIVDIAGLWVNGVTNGPNSDAVNQFLQVCGVAS
jgi:hypothetical protein